jgi:uncharacterized membrane protein HdeD (DUF308 family)
MFGKKKDEINFFFEIPDMRKYWRWFLAIGILLIVLGVLAIGFANWATEFTVILLGLLLVGGGILQVVNGCYATRWTGFSLSLFLGLFYIIAGVLCIFKPMQSATGISLLISALLLVGGSFRLVSALRYRFDQWEWVVFNGFAAILLGFLILAEWPASAIWVIGLFVGIDLLLMGCYWVRLSLAARK